MAERLGFECPSVQYDLKNLPRTEVEFKEIDGHQFAEMICDLMGWRVNQKKSGDGGIDAWNGDYPIQIKNHSKSSAGRPDIQKFFGALANENQKKGFFVAWDFSKDAMEYIADMKQDHKVEIIPMKCIEVFGALLIDSKKGQEIERLYQERYPKEWSKKQRATPATAAETKSVLDKAKESKERHPKRARDRASRSAA
jgi:hypothetical protein